MAEGKSQRIDGMGEYVRRQLLMKMVDYLIGQTRLACWKSTSLETRELEGISGLFTIDRQYTTARSKQGPLSPSPSRKHRSSSNRPSRCSEQPSPEHFVLPHDRSLHRSFDHRLLHQYDKMSRLSRWQAQDTTQLRLVCRKRRSRDG